jgi:hypothetical protein
VHAGHENASCKVRLGSTPRTKEGSMPDEDKLCESEFPATCSSAVTLTTNGSDEDGI